MKATFYISKRQNGVTLVELLIAIVVLGILVALALPSFQGVVERKRLEGATEKLFADFQFAKSEAIKRNQPVFVSFDDTNQCYGLSVGASCACNTAGSCVIDIERVVKMTEFPNVIINDVAFGAVTYTSFDPRRGTAAAGHVYFTNKYAAGVKLSSLGKITVCVPSGGDIPSGTTPLSKYPDC